MNTHCIPLYDIAPQGIRGVMDDPVVFATPIAQFGMNCRVSVPLRVEYTFMPMDGGCLVRGTLSGAVIIPCDRCAEDCSVRLHHSFETFAPFPDGGGEDSVDGGADDASHHVRIDNGVPVLDMAALGWEEFLLALPMRPLCKADCKGLCAHCGTNFNMASCGCADTVADSRLAALHSLKIQKTAC